MPETNVEKTSEEQINDHYQAIGRFVVNFERIVYELNRGIKQFFEMGGLADQQISNIFLADQTADPTLKAYISMCSIMFELDKEEESIVNAICKEVRSTIELRNTMLHSTWFIGLSPGGNGDCSGAIRFKAKKSGSGVKFDSETLTAEEINTHADRCLKVANFIETLSTVLYCGITITGNFKIKDKKVSRSRAELLIAPKKKYIRKGKGTHSTLLDLTN